MGQWRLVGEDTMSKTQKNFDVVRKGYDVTQVDAFVAADAEARASELAEVRKEVAELQTQLEHRDKVEVEVREEASSLKAEVDRGEKLRMEGQKELSELRAKVDELQEKLDVREAEAADLQRLQTVLSTEQQSLKGKREEMLHEVDVEIGDKRRAAEQELAQLRRVAETEMQRLRTDADQQSLSRADVALREQQQVLEERREALDVEYASVKGKYDRTLATLNSKVTELQATHTTLVQALEGIAAGGLASMKVDDEELPPPIVGEDDLFGASNGSSVPVAESA